MKCWPRARDTKKTTSPKKRSRWFMTAMKNTMRCWHSNAREVNQFRSIRESNTYNGYDLCQQGGDYEHCEKRRLSELRPTYGRAHGSKQYAASRPYPAGLDEDSQRTHAPAPELFVVQDPQRKRRRLVLVPPNSSLTEVARPTASPDGSAEPSPREPSPVCRA
jgi:hypothetical protein